MSVVLLRKLANSRKEPLAPKKILKIISQVLGWCGLAIPHMGGPSGTGRSDTTAEIVNTMGMAFDTAQKHLKEEQEKQWELMSAKGSECSTQT